MLRGHNSVHSRTEYQTQESALSTVFCTFKVLFQSTLYVYKSFCWALSYFIQCIQRFGPYEKKKENCPENYGKEISPHTVPHTNLACEYNHE